MDWNYVSERLPAEPSEDVVFESTPYIVSDGFEVGVCNFDRGYFPRPWANWNYYGDIRGEDIVKWMPFPKA